MSGTPVPVLPCHWPLRSTLVLGAYESAVPCARLHAWTVALEWGHPTLAGDVELVVSELVTNAVRLSRALGGYRWRGAWRAGTPPVRLYLCGDTRRVVVQVWDAAEGRPAVRSPGLEDEHGRGLLLVEAVAAECGAWRPADGGKVTWAEIA